MTKAICIDNSGSSSSYGIISNIIEIGEEVKIISTCGCCHHIEKENGKSYILNVRRFEFGRR